MTEFKGGTRPDMSAIVYGLMVLLSVTVTPSAVAEAQGESLIGEIGVMVGSWANYESSITFYNSNIPGYEEQPMWLKVIESIEWFILEVTEVAGNSVTIQFGTYYRDGTQQFENRTGDPITGSGNLADALAPAGLGPGGQFYVWLEEWGYQGPSLATVSGTYSRSYGGEVREVNHVKISLPHPEGGSHSFEYYFDKETGICVEQLIGYSYVGVHDGAELYLRYSWSVAMTATNLWGPASAVIPDPESVTKASPVIIDAAETASAVVVITNISNSTMIKIEKATEAPPAPSGLQPVGDFIHLDTSKMVATIAVLRISYDPAELSEKGIAESMLAIHYWGGGAWVPVESHVNAEERYVWAEITHFSHWALMGEEAPAAEEGTPLVWIIMLGVGAAISALVLLYLSMGRR